MSAKFERGDYVALARDCYYDRGARNLHGIFVAAGSTGRVFAHDGPMYWVRLRDLGVSVPIPVPADALERATFVGAFVHLMNASPAPLCVHGGRDGWILRTGGWTAREAQNWAQRWLAKEHRNLPITHSGVLMTYYDPLAQFHYEAK